MAIEDEHYKFLTAQIAARDMRPVEYLKLYIQFYTAVIGGSIWLRSQHPTQDRPVLARYAILSDTLMVLGSIVTILLVIDCFKSWHGYRKAQANFAKQFETFDVPHPKLKAGIFMELGIISCVTATALIFMVFNPFQT